MALTKIDDRGLTTPIDLLDNEKIRFGTGNDLEIYHDGSHSYLKNTNGIQFINGNTIYMRTEDSSEDYLRATQNGAVELYYDGSKKLETTSEGTATTGRATITYTGNAGKPTLTLGADNSQGSTSLTNSTSKGARVGVYHYTNAEEPANIFYAVGSDTSNQINYGGGTSYMNAATHHKFFTADNITTTSGTEKLRIDGNGRVSINTDTPHCVANGVHIKTNDSGVTSASVHRDEVFIEGNDHTGITIATPNDKSGAIGFDDPDGTGRGRIQYTHSSDLMYIYTSGSPRHEFTEHHKINDGNLVIGTSGHGIDFSAQTSTSASGAQVSGTGHEILTHYEEGQWTPVPDGTGQSYSYQTGRYTRIGNTVFYWFDVSWTGMTGNLTDGTIGGLPFTGVATTSQAGYGAPSFRAATGLESDIRVYGNSSYIGGDYIQLQHYQSSGAVALTDFLANGRVSGEGFYFTNNAY